MAAVYRYKVIIEWSELDGSFIATVPELPGCVADGADYIEAVIMAEQAIEDWIDTALELGREVPEPKGRDSHE